ncbi:MAG: hypothetical protein COX81_02815 [Candidatus Magasanikbacteria bacterium CG_4_10_14_0_2_um_filter_37_12]|uniref:Phosphatidic acid phosphatase type 2/haloperoxidase domain-containing protein n=1 Tax=Candidatus Magasanikbacteria bacterium CG_4_10_14_0_2_um_filter_37_12 TaxID=1974637 RepID=A0A2M7V7J3_9BACT|nr:MAG: hypothetical protein COX81_02815 [Candidatus Magasanikbacteria bacterium CG_4_10_14_0_2_um_filter_37_12]
MKRLSWSHKLFIKINKEVGHRLWLDNLMFFCAHWLIYILGIIVLGWGAFVLNDTSAILFDYLIKLLLTAILLAEVVSYSVAILWRHSRPVVEFPEIKLLLHTNQTWKSFPSDHTVISFILALVVSLLVGFNLFVVILLIMASLVAMGRVYVGVHYPRDILGGIFLAMVFAYFSPFLLNNFSQPIFSFSKQLFL